MIDESTLGMIGSVVACTAIVVWRIAAARADLVTSINKIGIKVERMDVKTQSVTTDHDKLVLVEAQADAAHRRIDELGLNV